MIKSMLAAFFLGGLFSTAAMAQHHGHHGGAGNPYAALADREVKVLSAEQMADLREGRGMGLSLPAELNGYPGPKHVLELTDGLGLTPVQRQKTTELFDLMKVEAVTLGARLITEEHALETLFTATGATLDATKQAVDTVARTQGELRFVHLKYHLLMAAALTPAQSRRYAELRGYVKQ